MRFANDVFTIFIYLLELYSSPKRKGKRLLKSIFDFFIYILILIINV